MNNKYKRQYRELNDDTKKKISNAMTGKTKSNMHKQHISQAMREYWQSVPNRPQPLSMDDYLHGTNNESTNRPKNETSM